MNLMMLLEMAQSSFGDRVAITNGDEHLTYQQLFEASAVAGEKARSAGAEYFAMLDESSFAFPTALFGAASNGARGRVIWIPSSLTTSLSLVIFLMLC